VPTRDFKQLIKNVDDTLKHLYKPKVEFLICGDINTDYLIESNQQTQLASLLTTYNLSETVNFVTKIQNNSSTSIDNIFVDERRINLSSVFPIINDLSGHDAQILTITIISLTRNINFFQTPKKSLCLH
jgi:hypothetical protein